MIVSVAVLPFLAILTLPTPPALTTYGIKIKMPDAPVFGDVEDIDTATLAKTLAADQKTTASRQSADPVSEDATPAPYQIAGLAPEHSVQGESWTVGTSGDEGFGSSAFSGAGFGGASSASSVSGGSRQPAGAGAVTPGNPIISPSAPTTYPSPGPGSIASTLPPSEISPEVIPDEEVEIGPAPGDPEIPFCACGDQAAIDPPPVVQQTPDSSPQDDSGGTTGGDQNAGNGGGGEGDVPGGGEGDVPIGPTVVDNEPEDIIVTELFRRETAPASKIIRAT